MKTSDVLILLGLLWLCSSCSPYEFRDPTEARVVMIEDTKQATKRSSLEPEQEGTSQGTAWLMSKGYVVTNCHITDGATEIKLIAHDGSEFRAKTHKQDKANDIALLKIIDEVELPHAIPIAREGEPIGAEVFALGYPLTEVMGTNLKYSSGRINSLSGIRNDPRVYQISVPIQSGNSGSPLLNKNGEAIGIVTSKLDALIVLLKTGDIPQNVNYAIKSIYIGALIAEEGITDIAVLPSTEASDEELVERIKDSVFIVVAQ